MRGPSAHITDCVDDYKMRLAVLTLALLATLVAHSEATRKFYAITVTVRNSPSLNIIVVSIQTSKITCKS